MNYIENGIDNIPAAFWYNNSDEDMRALCEEVTNFSEFGEFMKLKPFEPKEPFNGFIVIPRVDCEPHDSGYSMIKIALTNHGRVVGCVEGCTDVLHLNEIWGYGKFGDKYSES